MQADKQSNDHKNIFKIYIKTVEREREKKRPDIASLLRSANWKASSKGRISFR